MGISRKYMGYWWGILKERDLQEYQDVGGRIKLRGNLNRIVWSGFIWLSIGTSGGHL
jgi:hypothetical protein